MHYGQRDDTYFTGPERLRVDRIQLQLWNTGIFLLTEGIKEFRPDLFEYDIGTEQRHVGVLEEIVCPYVVESGEMIAVTMSKQYGVEMADIFAKHLLAKIRTGIDDETDAVHFYMNGRAEPLIAVVEGATHFARAPDYGHALRCAGTEERDFQTLSVIND